MKNSKEMADAVFRIRDEYMEKKRRRGRVFGRAAMIAAPACLAAVLIAGGYAILSDRQTITADRTSAIGMQTTAVTAPVTAVSAAEKLGGAEETNALKDGAVTPKTKTTKKETKAENGAAPAVTEEYLPETIIPDGETAQPETAAAAETEPSPTDTTTTSAAVARVEETSPVYQPDEQTDGIPEISETVNEAMVFTAESLYRKYPTVFADREYACAETTVTEDMLGDVMSESETGTVYHLAEKDRIAVRFAGTDIYIVYETKEDQ